MKGRFQLGFIFSWFVTIQNQTYEKKEKSRMCDKWELKEDPTQRPQAGHRAHSGLPAAKG